MIDYRFSLKRTKALDGIRAVAIGGVIFYHGEFGYSQGGFLGVDVFFTLSGFLITSLLLSDISGSGRIGVANFWKRRAFRLLPGLFVMLSFAFLLAIATNSYQSYPSFRKDMVSSVFYFANWHFILFNDNYFAQGTPSLILHTWSLSVEEQFYIVWPFMLLLLIRLFKKLSRVSIGVAALLFCSILETLILYSKGFSFTRLYFGTDTQAQSILVGALLATLIPMSSKFFASRAKHIKRNRPVFKSTNMKAIILRMVLLDYRRLMLEMLGIISLLGLGLLFVYDLGPSYFTFHGGILLASFLTAAIILNTIILDNSVVSRLLGSSAIAFIGKVSYELYLFHYPVFLIINSNITKFSGYKLFLTRVLITFAVSLATYMLIDNPIRLKAKNTKVSFGKLGLVVLLLISVIATLIAPTPATARSLADKPIIKKTFKTGTNITLPKHVYTMVLLGDSMAQTLGNGLEGLFSWRYGFNVINKGDPNCSSAMGYFRVKNYSSRPSDSMCQPGSGTSLWPQVWPKYLQQYNPQAVVFIARLDIVDRLYEGRWVHIGDPAYDQYLESLMEEAVRITTSMGAKFIFLTSPYYDTGLQPNGLPWPEDNPERVNLYNQMMSQVAEMFPGKAFVFNLNKLVDPDGVFQEYVDGVQVRYTDGIHWTYQGDWWLAPRVLPNIYAAAAGCYNHVDISDIPGKIIKRCMFG